MNNEELVEFAELDGYEEDDLDEVEKEVEEGVPVRAEPRKRQLKRAGFRIYANGNVRCEVRVSRYLHDQLHPLAERHILAEELVREAEEIGLVEANKWVSKEKLTPGETTAILWVTPTQKFLRKCARYYVSPQMLLRGAANKLADKLERERLRKLVRE